MDVILFLEICLPRFIECNVYKNMSVVQLQ